LKVESIVNPPEGNVIPLTQIRGQSQDCDMTHAAPLLHQALRRAMTLTLPLAVAMLLSTAALAGWT